jgi:hypothetical protein
MLSDKEKDKIRSEEIYRAEVIKEIKTQSERPQTRMDKFWEILNKPFVLWALSSILLGLFSWGFTTYQANAVKERERETKISMLDVEIANRIEFATALIGNPTDNDSKLIGISMLTGTFEKNVELYNTFPEFKLRTTYSLVWELNSLLPRNEKASFRSVFNGYKIIRHYFNEHAMGIDRDTSQNTTASSDTLVKLINDSMLLQRWKAVKGM